MDIDKEKVEGLTSKIDELVVIINNIMSDLRQVSASLKSLAVSQITQPPSSEQSRAPSQAIEGSPETPERSKALEDIKMMFPEDLEGLLGFEEKAEYVVIQPRQFLGSENFSKVASIVRGIGGNYVSAGKSSHFRVPKKRA
jgi:hypothetical protein